MGGTGDPPVLVGDPPTSFIATLGRAKSLPLARCRASRPAQQAVACATQGSCRAIALWLPAEFEQEKLGEIFRGVIKLQRAIAVLDIERDGATCAA